MFMLMLMFVLFICIPILQDPEAEGLTAEAFANTVHEPMDFGRVASKLAASASTARLTAEGETTTTATAAATVTARRDEGGDDDDATATARGCHGETATDTDDDNDDEKTAASDGGEATAGERGKAAAATAAEATATAAEGGVPNEEALVAGTYVTVPAFARDMNLVFSNVRRVWPMGSVGSDNALTKAADSLKMVFDERWRALAPRLHSIQVGQEAWVGLERGGGGTGSVAL